VWGLSAAERRALLLLALVFLIGAAYDLWRARRGAPAQAPPAAGVEPAPMPAISTAPLPGAATEPRRLQLNRAGVEELDGLPGIGPVLAGRIVAYRREHGPFRGPEELRAVRGIGPALLSRLLPRVATDSL
jgi:competence protein ComEA